MKKVASCKNFHENFAYLKENFLQILQHFANFFPYLFKKSKEISQIKKNIFNYFRILKKTEKGFSCTVNN